MWLLLLFLASAHARFSSVIGVLSISPVQSYVVAEAGCLQLCDSRPWCRAASVGPDGACRLFATSVAAAGLTASSGWATFEKEDFANPCPPLFFYDLGVGACAATLQCTPGQYMAIPATIVSNAVCAACGPDTFQPVRNQPACLPVAMCAAAYVERAAPTATTDRRCEGPVIRLTFSVDVPGSATDAAAAAPAHVATMLAVATGLSTDEARVASTVAVRAASVSVATVAVNLTLLETLGSPMWASLCRGRLHYPTSPPLDISSLRVFPSCTLVPADYAASSSSSSSSSSSGSAATAALGAVLGVALLVLGLLAFVLVRRRQQRAMSVAIDTPPETLALVRFSALSSLVISALFVP